MSNLDTAELLAMQAPKGVPISTYFETVTDPLVPSGNTEEMLAHFWEEIYDLRPTTHLARLLKILLGDSGTGQLRKRTTYAHLSTVLLTTHYNDLDRLYAEVFGLKRFLREKIDPNTYLALHTDAEWEALNAADAAYRSRIEAFGRAIAMGGTPQSMITGASAVLGVECRLYESYEFIDNEDVYTDEDSPSFRAWGELESFTYSGLEDRPYADLEGTPIYRGRAPGSRTEFVVRPLGNVTPEQRFRLVKALERIKPAKALLSIDARETAVYTPLPAFRAVSDSTYWQVGKKVQAVEANFDYYHSYDDGDPVEQPRLPFAQYQGESWSYNSDVVSVGSMVLDASGNVVQNLDYERRTLPSGVTIDYNPEKAMLSAENIARSELASDGSIVYPVRGGL